VSRGMVPFTLKLRTRWRLIDQLHPSADLTPGQNVPKSME